jgi:hypothetical protein
MPLDMIHVGSAPLSHGHRRPFCSTIGFPEYQPFCRSWLESPFYFAFQQRYDKSIIHLTFANQKKSRGHTPDLVPQKALSCYFKICITSSLPDTDPKDIPPRIFIPDTGKIREIMAANKIPGSPIHRRCITGECGEIVPVRPGLCIISRVKLGGHFCVTGTPAVRGELEVQSLDGTIREFRSKCKYLPACMDTAISSSCTKKSGIPPIGKKVQSLAGSHKISFYGSVCCLHLRAKKSAAQI